MSFWSQIWNRLWGKPEEKPLPLHDLYLPPREFVDYVRGLEAQLTDEQRDLAFEIARQRGWAGKNPPPFAWAIFFREAMEKRPAPYQQQLPMLH